MVDNVSRGRLSNTLYFYFGLCIHPEGKGMNTATVGLSSLLSSLPIMLFFSEVSNVA